MWWLLRWAIHRTTTISNWTSNQHKTQLIILEVLQRKRREHPLRTMLTFNNKINKEPWWHLHSNRTHRLHQCSKMLIPNKCNRHLNNIEKIYHHWTQRDKSNLVLKIEVHPKISRWPYKLIVLKITNLKAVKIHNQVINN